MGFNNLSTSSNRKAKERGVLRDACDLGGLDEAKRNLNNDIIELIQCILRRINLRNLRI